MRFHYDAKDIHGIRLDLQDSTRFELVCYHSYQWECESEANRFMVSQVAGPPARGTSADWVGTFSRLRIPSTADLMWPSAVVCVGSGVWTQVGQT